MPQNSGNPLKINMYVVFKPEINNFISRSNLKTVRYILGNLEISIVSMQAKKWIVCLKSCPGLSGRECEDDLKSWENGGM